MTIKADARDYVHRPDIGPASAAGGSDQPDESHRHHSEIRKSVASVSVTKYEHVSERHGPT